MPFFKSLIRRIKNFFVFFFVPFKWYKIPLILILLYFVATPFIMILNYDFPEFFTPETTNEKPGVVLTSTLIQMGTEMLDAWLPNDVIYPTIFLDNPQNFQLGELEIYRYTLRVLRDKLSRLRTTDTIDENCDQAFVFISNDPKRWILPSAENRYNNAVKQLKQYQKRLEAGTANFYPRVDNLIELLDQFNSLLGGVNTRLSNAPRDRVVTMSEETAGDQFIQGEKPVNIRVPWLKIDDNFYFTRGVAYGLRQIMLAIQYEFREVLELKKSMELMDKIIELLNICQFEPIYVANGSRGSLWANHSLELLATTEDIRQKMRSLQDMLRN